MESPKNRIFCRKNFKIRGDLFYYIESPGDFVGLGIGTHTAFKIHVVPFFDVGSIQITAQTQHRLRYI